MLPRTANIERFSGYAAEYDAVRPRPPDAALAVLCEIVGKSVPDLVVDVGSGTGLSTRTWIGKARRVVGVEPNDDMRRQAERATSAPEVEYRAARAEATGLPDGCADLVCCVQALHWLDPPTTFAEAHRILRAGGAFAALDCDWPPFVHWQLVEPWHELRDAAECIVTHRGLAPGLKHWDKERHLERMRASGHFRCVTELCFHQRTSGDAERLIALAKSQGGLATALKAQDAEAHERLSAFAARVRALLGTEPAPWTYTYRVRIGIR